VLFRSYDIRDPETFTKIGTDQQTFQERYQHERCVVMADDRLWVTVDFADV